MRTLVTQAIIGHLVLGFTEDGWRIELCDQDGGGLYLYAAPDGKVLKRKNIAHWVRLEPSNAGADIIVDYSTQPEVQALVERTNEYAAVLQALD